MTRIMGLDPGERRVGVALSDELGMLATPLVVLERRSRAVDLSVVAELVQRHGVTEVVVGHPRTLRGEVGPQARRAERFAAKLGEAVGIPVRLWDERYSTVEAVERLERDGKRPRGRRPHPDAAAAAVILQGYLDSRR
jgi:putative holliday junction resolvase